MVDESDSSDSSDESDKNDPEQLEIVKKMKQLRVQDGKNKTCSKTIKKSRRMQVDW